MSLYIVYFASGKCRTSLANKKSPTEGQRADMSTIHYIVSRSLSWHILFLIDRLIVLLTEALTCVLWLFLANLRVDGCCAIGQEQGYCVRHICGNHVPW
jgi:hypothetical protein